MSDDAVEISNNEAELRWEARLGDEVVGFAEYRPLDGRMLFTHTVVEPEHEGSGIGSRLARTALDDAAGRGLRIIPRCPFIRSYLERHTEYADLVDLPR